MPSSSGDFHPPRVPRRPPVRDRRGHSQIIALEGSNMNMQTFNAMRSGAQAMKDARGRLDVDQVDDVMDDIKEEMDTAEQVRSA